MDKIHLMVFKGQFKSTSSLMCLLVHEIFWLNIMKRLFRKMLWEAEVNLLVIGLAIVHESLATFCHVFMKQGRV